MNIVICGAGEVGRHAAEVLGADGSNITIIDLNASRLEDVENVMDVRTLLGNGAHADVLTEAGCDEADLVIAATEQDEMNMLCASLAAGLGAQRTIARVHHGTYYEGRGIDYAHHFGIDHMVCPDQATAEAIAHALRNPGALAVELFARGKIEMQQLTVSPDAHAVGTPLIALQLPASVRLAAIERGETAFIPDAQTTIQANDVVTLVGESEVFDKARKLFHTDALRRRRVMVMGGTPLGVWLCRSLRSPNFAVRLYEPDRQRAEQLADKLDWVTVVREDVMEGHELAEEQVGQVSAFVALTDDDESNILCAARAKSMGAHSAIAVLQRPTYLHLLKHVGIDQAFSPRVTAVTQIQSLIWQGPIRRLGAVASGFADLYEITADKDAQVVNRPLKGIQFPMRTLIVAIQRGDDVRVPGADDVIQPDDTVVVIAPPDAAKPLGKLFGL
jgi:trk system potassium uptake protein TrkA